jgi:hypothetical protein
MAASSDQPQFGQLEPQRTWVLGCPVTYMRLLLSFPTVAVDADVSHAVFAGALRTAVRQLFGPPAPGGHPQVPFTLLDVQASDAWGSKSSAVAIVRAAKG